MNPDTAWDALNAALDHEAPGCSALDLFTADRRTDEQRARWASILRGVLCWIPATRAPPRREPSKPPKPGQYLRYPSPGNGTSHEHHGVSSPCSTTEANAPYGTLSFVSSGDV